jgi:hypothetical protein
MPQIFHPSMNTFARVSIFGAVFIVAGAVLLMWVIVRSPYATEVGVIRSQPVPFSHQHHVGEIGIDCRYCHRTVETQAFAGMPETEVCLDCHSVLFRDSELLEPVRVSFQAGKPIDWTRVHDVPDYAYFHHGVHVQAGIGCETCHGRVDKMPLMWRNASLHMEWCLDCHRNPKSHIRPRSEVFTMGWEPREDAASADDLMVSHDIQNRTNCSACHR